MKKPTLKRSMNYELNCPKYGDNVYYLSNRQKNFLPLVLFIIVLVVFIIFGLYIINRLINSDRNGNCVSDRDRLIASIILVSVHTIGGIYTSLLVYRAIEAGDNAEAWLLFWLSIFVPVIFFVTSIALIEFSTFLKF